MKRGRRPEDGEGKPRTFTFFSKSLFYVGECLSVCMYVSYTCVWCPYRTEEGARSLKLTDGCEPQHGQWELNLAHLVWQPGLLAPEPSLRP